MSKTILITGSTDGIGLATAKMFAEQGHQVLLHGRSAAKLEDAIQQVQQVTTAASPVQGYLADLSDTHQVQQLAEQVLTDHSKLDVLLNNAGIFRVADAITQQGYDVRFAVNTFAPYLLTQALLPALGTTGRVVSLSSAAQAPVDLAALKGERQGLEDFEAYAQSKLALTMWSRSMASELQHQGPVFIAVNPGSMLGSKMVKEGFGVAGGDINKGARILVQASLDEDFAQYSGHYFDNDIGKFGPAHPDAANQQKVDAVLKAIIEVVNH